MTLWLTQPTLVTSILQREDWIAIPLPVFTSSASTVPTPFDAIGRKQFFTRNRYRESGDHTTSDSGRRRIFLKLLASIRMVPPCLLRAAIHLPSGDQDAFRKPSPIVCVVPLSTSITSS